MDEVAAAHAPGDQCAETDGGVDVAARDRPDAVGHADQREAERQRDAEEVRINTDRLVKEKRIEADRTINTAEIDKNLAVQKSQIEADRETKVKQAQRDSKLVVLLKNDDEATYRNVIDVIDEFMICQIAKYFAVDEGMTPLEKKLIAQKIKS